jgi:hypothetical protein
MYIANERLHVAPGIWREVGAPVPEAETWHPLVRESYLRNARIRIAPDAPPGPPSKPHADALGTRPPAHPRTPPSAAKEVSSSA